MFFRFTLGFHIDRCQWELAQWIRDEAEGVRTPILRQFYDYMISLSENLDAVFLSTSNHNEMEQSSNTKCSTTTPSNHHHETKGMNEMKVSSQNAQNAENHTIHMSADRELWELDETNFEFEMMVRIKELTECVEDAVEAQFVLDVLDALDDDLFFASPVIQSILKFIGNDIRFMSQLRSSCADKVKCIKILQSMERYNRSGSLLPMVWKLLDATLGDETMVERILMNTDNLKQRDAEVLSLGVYKACNLDLAVAIPAFECVVGDSNEYIFHHLTEILLLCRSEMENGTNLLIGCSALIEFRSIFRLTPFQSTV